MNPSADNVRDQLVTLLPRLRRFARALTRNVREADELVRVSLERGQLSLHARRGVTRLDSWMLGIVANAWIDATRSRRRREALHPPQGPGEPIADSSSGAPISRLSIDAALERLPDEQRLVVALVLIEGLTYKEAAAVLEMPVDTVTSRLARGRETLAALLGGS